MTSWGDLGVVDTIYEEEDEDSFTSPSLSPSISSPPTSLHSRIEAWSQATGRNTDILINVEGSRFYLHKDRLTCKSRYLKRQLTDVSAITLSPPLKITAETFALIADFCYGGPPVISPFNAVALRITAELLEMTDANGDGEQSLVQRTEAYFLQILTVNCEYALVLLRSSLALLPEAETTAFLVSRCIEALSLTDGDGILASIYEIKTLRIENFQIVAESMHNRFTKCHDILYRIVDLYIKESTEKITEEQKSQLCNTIDCTKLSTQLLMHAVQNPRMPLRFIVRAMFIEQLNTRHSVISATADHRLLPRDNGRTCTHTKNKTSNDSNSNSNSTTLGAILHRDAALRQVAQLKAAMDTTSSRIQSLEKDLNGMKKTLLLQYDQSEEKRNVLESGKSTSFRYSSGNKIERGERGSASSASLRFSSVVRGEREGGSSSSEGGGSGNDHSSPRSQKNFGRRLINGLKNAFRVSNVVSKHDNGGEVSSKMEKVGVGNEEDGIEYVW